VTVTADLVSLDPTRLLPKSKLVVLMDAVEAVGTIESAAVAV
jgi:hypothetical protein